MIEIQRKQVEKVHEMSSWIGIVNKDREPAIRTFQHIEKAAKSGTSRYARHSNFIAYGRVESRKEESKVTTIYGTAGQLNRLIFGPGCKNLSCEQIRDSRYRNKIRPLLKEKRSVRKS